MQKNWEDLGQIFQFDHDQNFISQQISEIMVHTAHACKIMIDILSSGAGLGVILQNCTFLAQNLPYPLLMKSNRHKTFKIVAIGHI